ncbi:hypothetical protein FQA39_LY10017 [Lamprigera yunnana]|nr:hypothetical protein FQA39_LY10017 [Lamprigera yunnana]
MWLYILSIAALLLYLFVTKSLNYWKYKGVAQYDLLVVLREIFFGIILYRSFIEVVKGIYNDFPGRRYCGTYQLLKPTLVIRDRELIKQLTIKDFDHFTDHFQIVPENSEPMWEKNLFSLTGEKWKHMRATLSPSFTSSKMKIMFTAISECAKNFVEFFDQQPGTITVEMKDIFTRVTNDIIATTAFGINCDSMRNPNNEFYTMGKSLTTFRGLIINLKFALMFVLPILAKKFNVKLFPQKFATYFLKIVKENIESRKKNNIVRPDMIHLLLEARSREELSDEDITAQALIFFFAGFDSVSTLMCFMTHELAMNVDVQKRLQSEIDDILNLCEGNLTYEALSKMKYMDMVVSEALRK